MPGFDVATMKFQYACHRSNAFHFTLGALLLALKLVTKEIHSYSLTNKVIS